MILRLGMLLVLGMMLGHPSMTQAADHSPPLLPAVQAYVDARCQEFNQIPADRQALLKPLANYIRTAAEQGEPAKLIFICTHNSRRSHLAQIWASVAAHRYGLKHVAAFSGGTQSTAFNPRAVATLQRAGLEIERPAGEDNPRYQVRFTPGAAVLTCFSKRYDADPNPRSDFGAVLTCSEADTACPLVTGAQLRISLPYDDPKSSDGSSEESQKYDERCAQIARELLFACSQALP